MEITKIILDVAIIVASIIAIIIGIRVLKESRREEE